jgi:uncharacterized protein (TIGR03437 family)
VIVSTNTGSLAANIVIAASAATVFTANSSGQGALAAQTVSVTAAGEPGYMSTTMLSGATLVNTRIVLSSTSNTYLLLYGTGFDDAGSVTATINGQTLTPSYFGPQGNFTGLDQINALLPPSLAGSGDLNVSITADGHISNVGTISFQ